jgi:hypothetical protein
VYPIGQNGQYFVRYVVESWLGGTDDEAWRIQIEGVILHASEANEDGDVCGRVRAHVLLGEGRMDAEEFDHDAWVDYEELDDIAKVVFTPSGAWSDSVLALWDDINSLDVFVIEEIFLERPNRGQDLGLAVAERTISLFGRGCGLAVICPWPTEVKVPGDEDEARMAHRKLGKHYERLGFRHMSGTDLWARSLEHSMTRDSN